MTPRDFLRRYWQKAPRLMRRAMPQCARLVDRDRLVELACRDDMESRLVSHRGGRWQVAHGPFALRDFRRLPRAGWTLLVQGINHAIPDAQRLLDRFSFLPYARLDDVMASYAPPGGGVGPHYDEYDVFLLQGQGARRWRISGQRDLALVEDAPLRILSRFRAAREWIVEEGDLLYLPPRWAHDGVAAGGECITYSIGFRAPSAQELAAGFLDFLQEHAQLPGRYEDPWLTPARRPARLDDRMVRQCRRLLGQLRWDARDVTRFLGCHLTEPKPQVRFRRPARPLTEAGFARRAARGGVRLALPTRMLFRGSMLFINGEACEVKASAARVLNQLADRRALHARAAPGREVSALLYRWYRAGYIEPGDGE